MVSSLRKPVFCPVRKPLSDSFVEATRELVRLHYAEAEALIHGKSLERFDVVLDLARYKKDKLKLAYLLHVRKHDCGGEQLLQTIGLDDRHTSHRLS